MCQSEYVSLVLRLERMTIEDEVDPSLAALLMWCLFFALEKGGGAFMDSMQEVDDVLEN